MRYSELRRAQAQSNTANDELLRLGLEQEVFYNTGRVFHEVGLFNLAESMYRKALQIAADEPRIRSSATHVTYQAAHNIILIYNTSGATSLAMDVMLKHLSFD